MSSYSTTSTDRELFAGFRAGDQLGFELLFKRYFEGLSHYAFRYLKDNQAAEDVVQDVFFKLWNKREQLRAEIEIKPYLFIAVKNTSLNQIKSNSRISDVDDDHFGNMVVNNRTAADDMELHELEMRVKQVIDTLPPKCREVFILSRYEEKSYKEIAEHLNISVKTVENQMGKALKRLREGVGKYMKPLLLFILIHFFSL